MSDDTRRLLTSIVVGFGWGVICAAVTTVWSVDYWAALIAGNVVFAMIRWEARPL